MSRDWLTAEEHREMDRRRVIEECAKAIDDAAIEADNDGWSACDYAAYLRSLKK